MAKVFGPGLDVFQLGHSKKNFFWGVALVSYRTLLEWFRKQFGLGLMTFYQLAVFRIENASSGFCQSNIGGVVGCEVLA